MKFQNTRVFENKIAVGEFHAILREDFVIKFLFMVSCNPCACDNGRDPCGG